MASQASSLIDVIRNYWPLGVAVLAALFFTWATPGRTFYHGDCGADAWKENHVGD